MKKNQYGEISIRDRVILELANAPNGSMYLIYLVNAGFERTWLSTTCKYLVVDGLIEKLIDKTERTGYQNLKYIHLTEKGQEYARLLQEMMKLEGKTDEKEKQS